MSDHEQLSYTRRQAAEATGLSEYMIGAAVRSGELTETYPVIDGKAVKKGLILRDDLMTWLRAGVTS